MRVFQLTINKWRNLKGVVLDVPEDSSVVCLVGENGSGKSTILELLSAVAFRLGISAGLDIPRGNPFDEVHDLSVLAQVPHDARDEVRERIRTELAMSSVWDGTIRLTSRAAATNSAQTDIQAAGITPGADANAIGALVVRTLQQREETQHLFLDADRAYPPIQIQAHQMGDIWSQEWESASFSRQWTFRPTKTLYEEWSKYFLGTEERIATQYITEIRRWQHGGENGEQPRFFDPFDSYRLSIQAVLPHLRFVGVESQGAQRSILFDSAGLEIPFHKLSGGEREIAFLIGQIERFKLRRGLLLIDEPELHLNPDLLRTWVAFLRDTVTDGQVWLATHSLEAVEVAGPESSFVFEKDQTDRQTRSVSKLAGRPVVSALSAAVGAPAFSLSRLRFVFVEGERHSRERERFYDVAGEPNVNRFMEGGSCHEVLRRLQNVTQLAGESGEQLHVGAVIDRDFRTLAEVQALETGNQVHVLRCHEIENVFLEPDVVAVLLSRSGRSESPTELIRRISDKFAGLWVAQWASANVDIAIPKPSMKVFGPVDWDDVSSRFGALVENSLQHVLEPSDRVVWQSGLFTGRERYSEVREQDDFWLWCLGKQALGRLAADLGFSSPDGMRRQILQLWNGGTAIPSPVSELRDFLHKLV